jgi:hypothetical protein
MGGSSDGVTALQSLRTAWVNGTIPIEEAAFRFESLMWDCDFGERMRRDLPPIARGLVNQMELVRFTVAEVNQRDRVLELLDEAAGVLQHLSP